MYQVVDSREKGRAGTNLDRMGRSAPPLPKQVRYQAAPHPEPPEILYDPGPRGNLPRPSSEALGDAPLAAADGRGTAPRGPPSPKNPTRFYVVSALVPAPACQTRRTAAHPPSAHR